MMFNTSLRCCLLLIIGNFYLQIQAQNMKMPTFFEKDNNTTATYVETISFYQRLATQYDQLQLKEMGTTDSGNPLHVAVLSLDKDFDPRSNKKNNRLVLFINNAIHPGEPCGVDATMMLFRDYLEQPDKQRFLKNVVLVAIPFYNIGGGLNRGSFSRANQVGPEAYGFRGNAKNLDLNRDFIKCDSKNAMSFNRIFSRWQPDVFIDNHTSNGADYPYTMTMLATQKDKLDPYLSEYMEKALLPRLYKDMEQAGWEMIPYVNVRSTPDDGIAGFLDLPRYGSGYGALHNCISFTAEAHMLKPYKDRVQSTYAFMDATIRAMNEDHIRIAQVHTKAQINAQTKKTFDLNWEMDREEMSTLLFKGYEAKYKPSEVTGLERLYYDRSAPYEKKIPFYNTFKTTVQVDKPQAYIIPQAYTDVIDRLRWNGVKVSQLATDIELEVEMYYIKDYKDRAAYEGHYLHQNIEVDKVTQKWNFYTGDFVVQTNQLSNRYIVETLEPQAPDSYFAWNFFDGILMQKEYFSPYVFEDIAAKLLKEKPKLQAELEQKRKDDEKFAESAWAQLMFVYRHSPYYEPTHNLYPVGRVMTEEKLRLK